MARESHFSQFVLGIDPLVQGLEHNHEFLGIKSGMGMLEIPSKNQSSHFPKDFVYRDLPVSSSKNFLVSTDAIGVLESLHHSGSGVRLQQQQLFMQQTRDLTLQPLFHLKNSEYLKPAQELLSEFCNLGGDRSSYERPNKASHSEREPSASSSWEQSLYSMNRFELQQLKIKLFSMLEKVDKRYRKHCEKMKAVVSSFESTAGEGAANVYLTLASKVISKHFRNLKDGIVGRINTVKKAMGEKDRLIAQGATRGETPRLKLLDQCIRQQKALQQGMAQQLPWRPQRGLPEHAVSILRAWLFEHFLHPYPSDVDKIVLARQTGLSRSQVSNWFINARVRIWKPMVEDMYLEEMKELDLQPNHPTTGHQHSNNQNPKPNSIGSFDLKTLPVQLLNVDSESLSSIINSSHHDDQSHTPSSKTWLHGSQHHQQTSRTENFGVVDFDFSYGSFASDNCRSGVSLTLGLQQHNKRGMSSSFSPASPQSLIFGGEHIGYGQQVGLSIADGEAQALPCRNLLGIQMLHDLTG